MKLPVLPTLLVGLAVAAMVALGIWQLHRSEEKEAAKAQIERNAALPPMALPVAAAVDQRLLFRTATAFCLQVTEWRKTGGQSASGKGGTRFIAECRTGAEGPGFAADMGVSADPKAVPAWTGGEVTGRVVAEPSRAGLWARITRQAPPPRPMIVSARAARGLEPSRPPTPDAIVNNSFGYAFQWFFFAVTAAVIYLFALRRRRQGGGGRTDEAA
jgi:cytochrome oxidase assembly protein ShyY1